MFSIYDEEGSYVYTLKSLALAINVANVLAQDQKMIFRVYDEDDKEVYRST